MAMNILCAATSVYYCIPLIHQLWFARQQHCQVIHYVLGTA